MRAAVGVAVGVPAVVVGVVGGGAVREGVCDAEAS